MLLRQSHRLFWLAFGLATALPPANLPAASPESARVGAPEAEIELFHDIILVKVRINGHGPFLMMLDTGADPSALDAAHADEWGLVRTGAEGTVDGGGTAEVKAYEVRAPRVDVGPLSVSNLEATAMDLSPISSKIGRPVVGILGHSFLNGHVVQIDYPKGRLRFLPAPYQPPPVRPGRLAVMHFKYEDDVIVDDVRVNGQPVRANVDTGSNGFVKITPEAVERLGLVEAAKRGTASTSTGFRGSYSTSEGTIDNLDLGGIVIKSPAAVFWAKGTGHDGKPWQINVGSGVLKEFVLTLDYPAGILVLEKPDSR
jgi:predicted aspartyl protease